MAAGELYLSPTNSTVDIYFRDSGDLERAVKGALNTGKWTSGGSVVPTAVSDGHVVMGHFFSVSSSRPICLAFRSSGSWVYCSVDYSGVTGLPSGQIRVSGTILQVDWDGWKTLRSP